MKKVIKIYNFEDYCNGKIDVKTEKKKKKLKEKKLLKNIQKDSWFKIRKFWIW